MPVLSEMCSDICPSGSPQTPGNRGFSGSHPGKAQAHQVRSRCRTNQTQVVELWNTLVPGFPCKITPAGRKVLMLQYRTNAGERRKLALGQYGELTVEQARSLA